VGATTSHNPIGPHGGFISHVEELRNVYHSPIIITIIEAWRLRFAEHVARAGEGERRANM
jgi:hypothetical protein